MRYYPVNLAVGGKSVVVIGGGGVACRKCLGLIAAGARVKVIAPALDDELADLASKGAICHVSRPYAPGDLAGAFLAFAATDDREVNRAVAREAESSGIPVDVTDAPDAGSFTTPAWVCRGDLLLTVSTGGKSPALAAKVRAELETRYGPEYGKALAILGAVREKLLTEAGNSAYNKKLLNALVDRDLPDLLRTASHDDIDRLLLGLLGPGFTLAELGVDEKDTA